VPPPTSPRPKAEASSSSSGSKGVSEALVPSGKDLKTARRMCDRLHSNVEYDHLKKFLPSSVQTAADRQRIFHIHTLSMFAKTLDSADSLDISTVLELASQGFVHTVASGAGASMACITGIGKGSLSVESYVDKKGVEMVRLGAVLQVAGHMVVPRSVFESDREGVRDNLERELSALSARSFESVGAGMEKELDRIQGGRLCFRIVGGNASAAGDRCGMCRLLERRD